MILHWQTLTPLLLGSLFLAGALYSDWRRYILPDALLLGLAICGFVFHLASGWYWQTPLTLLSASAFGAFLLWILRAVYWLWRKQEGLGLGDVKFMAAAGLWVGIGGIGPLLLIGSVATLGFALYHGWRQKLGWHKAKQLALPLGPGLGLGLILVLFLQLKGP
jgi:leader peptidase (prepilin peptidase) / N-methyltransferase